MTGYYDEKLAAERLLRCYEIASPRVKQYLQAEIDHVISHLKPTDRICELGCGYGRVLKELVAKARLVVGIDTSLASLVAARTYLSAGKGCPLMVMDAAMLAFREGSFDLVVCIQNGISAFKRDQTSLLSQAVGICKSGGKALFSSYSEAFWQERLEWFRAQSRAGLLGEIDEEKTGCGVIACRDGFVATTVSPQQFVAMAHAIGVSPLMGEVDGSSVFYEIRKS